MVGVNTDWSVLANLDTGVLIALGVLVAVQLILVVTALLALWRTPLENLRYLHHWGWTAIIVLVNIFGAVAFFLFARRKIITSSQVQGAEAAAIVAKLYGRDRV